jgi:hypothetical protein
VTASRQMLAITAVFPPAVGMTTHGLIGAPMSQVLVDGCDRLQL